MQYVCVINLGKLELRFFTVRDPNLYKARYILKRCNKSTWQTKGQLVNSFNDLLHCIYTVHNTTYICDQDVLT